MLPVFLLTNGIEEVEFVSKNVMAQQYEIGEVSFKSGGSWKNSPFSDGRQLVNYVWDNPVDDLDLLIWEASEDRTIALTTAIEKLLIQAADYWAGDESVGPVWLEVQGPCETGKRYAIVMMGEVRNLPNQFSEPWATEGDTTVVAAAIGVKIERSKWFDAPPGEPNCQNIKGSQSWTFSEWANRTNAPVQTVYGLFREAGGNLIAADESQIWLSVDDGVNWSARSFGAGHWDNDPSFVYAFCEQSGYVYAACANGIFRSADGGLTWTRRTAVRNGGMANCIIAHTNGALYLADKADGVYYSIDGGATWVAASTGLDASYVVNAIYEPRSVTGATRMAEIVCGYDGPGGRRVFYGIITMGSYNINWNGVYSLTEAVYSFYQPANSQYIYAGCDNGTIYRAKVNSLATWGVVTASLNGDIFSFAFDGAIYYATGNGIVYKSLDMVNWTVMTVTGAGQFYSLVFEPDGPYLYAGDPGDIFVLEILGDEMGIVVSTCEREAIISNHRVERNITHAYVYDASAGTYTRIFPATVLPVDLLPAVPAVGDYLLAGVGTSGIPDASTFMNLVFDIENPAADVTLVWEYYGAGATWRAFTTGLGWLQDNTQSGSQVLGLPGVHSVHWQQDALAWTAQAINGVTAYWARCRVTGIGADPTPPTQQNRNLYTVGWNHIEIEAGEVGGTLPALARIRAINLTDKDGGGGSLPDYWTNWMIVGLRRVERGENFVSYLNMAQTNNPPGVTLELGRNTSFSANAYLPAGQQVLYNPAAIQDIDERVRIVLSKDLTKHFYGEFCVYAILNEEGGAGNIEIRVVVETGSGGARQEGQIAVTKHRVGDGLVDLGQIKIPTGDLTSSEMADETSIILELGTKSAGASVYVEGLVLIPCDEWVAYGRDSKRGQYSACGNGKMLCFDSVMNPRSEIRCHVKTDDANEYMSSEWEHGYSGPVKLQANERQRLYFLAARYHTLNWTHDGANNLAYLSDSANFFTYYVEEGDIVVNTTDGSWGFVTSVASDTRLDVNLRGGTDNDFDTGDVGYVITKWLLAHPNIAHMVLIDSMAQYIGMRGDN